MFHKDENITFKICSIYLLCLLLIYYGTRLFLSWYYSQRIVFMNFQDKIIKMIFFYPAKFLLCLCHILQTCKCGHCCLMFTSLKLIILPFFFYKDTSMLFIYKSSWIMEICHIFFWLYVIKMPILFNCSLLYPKIMWSVNRVGLENNIRVEEVAGYF